MSKNENADEDLRLLTEPEAAELLGLKPRMLRELRRQGRITFRRLFARQGIRYTRADLAEFVKKARG